jgi:leucyl-tRNA synthetase
VVEDWKAIQEKVLRDWEQARIFEADPDPSKEKFFITVAYPYPNSPQHIGHARTYTITDVHARYLRMRGYNVLFPMAFHYTGTPILAMAERIAKGDPELVDDFLRIYHVPKEKLKDFGEPIEIARYFHEEIKRGMKDMGFSIDWRREFTTIDPTYSRFIEWQFKKLREKGLITKGSHPVGWCPNDGNPVGQHDTIGDVEPEIGQYVLLKFEIGDAYLPTATLRPETVFGVTNIWVKPGITYVKAKVDGENWIISEPCLKKLEYQNRKASIIERVQGSKLVGKSGTNPMTGAPVIVLPAEFVDPESATGVVMSVPAHAPYDYQALLDLEARPELLSQFGIGKDVVAKLSPIGVVTLEGYSDAPAVDIVKRFGIKDQSDAKLEEATTEIYSKEFHSGRMRNDTGNYAGLSVSEARDRVRDDLVAKGGADLMYEIINRPVTCRCGAQCLVKMFENQWFINYGDAKWKELARECLKSMSIVPEEFRVEIDYAIGWLREKACARKSGLGTRLPWDKDWIIESLSDSVIYMAYYTLAKHITKLNLKPEQLSDEILDYLLLGQGDVEKLARSSGIESSKLKEIRGEFVYFYPVDSRHSGRDLIPNHLTFYIFNHAAIFPPEEWPRQIVTNGSVLMEHAKMSKSFGNIIPLRDAIAQHGADAVRLSTVSAAELIQDVEFSHQSADSLRERIERMYASAQSIVEASPAGGAGTYGGNEEKWMLSRIQSCIRDTTAAMDKLRAREAVHHAMYELEQDLSWYMRRATARSGVNPEVVSRVLDIRVRLMAPFTPFISEAIWSLMGKKGFVSVAEWPQPDATLMDERAEEVESLVRTTVEDVANILKTTGMSVKKLYLYSAADWKWHLYLKALEMASKDSVGVPELMKAASVHPVLKERMKDVSKLAPRLAKDLQSTAPDMQEKRRRLGTFNEREALEDATGFLSKEFKCTVTVHDETDEKKYDPKGRAQAAQPFRPAIYVE